MSPRSSLRRAGVETAIAGRRRPTSERGAAIADYSALSLLSDRFDRLLRDASSVQSQREFERLADEASDIGDALVAVFRKSSSNTNAPRWQRGGQALW